MVALAETPSAPGADLDPDLRFLLDTQGFLHLRGALAGGELAGLQALVEGVAAVDPASLPGRDPTPSRYLDRPLSRVLDAEPRLVRLLDHPVLEPILRELLGAGYQHIDNDLLDTVPGYPGGGWHRGVRPDAQGYVRDGRFRCTMVKAFFCLSEVDPGGGAFALVPGSHRAQIGIPLDRERLPGMRVFDDVRAGDLIVFNEAVLHNGLPHRGTRRRRTLIVNFGRAGCGAWPGYAPQPGTLAASTPRQRAILDDRGLVWDEERAWAQAMGGV